MGNEIYAVARRFFCCFCGEFDGRRLIFDTLSFIVFDKTKSCSRAVLENSPVGNSDKFVRQIGHRVRSTKPWGL